MHAYSMDLRTRVLEAAEAGETTAELADRFAVSPAWVRRVRQRHRQTGEVAPRRPTRTRASKLRAHLPRIRELLAATPDLTLAELRDALGVAAALSTVWAAVRALGYTRKKSRSGRPSRTAPTSPPPGPRGGGK
jgi:transposase